MESQGTRRIITNHTKSYETLNNQMKSDVTFEIKGITGNQKLRFFIQLLQLNNVEIQHDLLLFDLSCIGN